MNTSLKIRTKRMKVFNIMKSKQRILIPREVLSPFGAMGIKTQLQETDNGRMVKVIIESTPSRSLSQPKFKELKGTKTMFSALETPIIAQKASMKITRAKYK